LLAILVALIFVREILGCAGFSGETLASKESAKVSPGEIGCSMCRFRSGKSVAKKLDNRRVVL
jgi:hypothetical protein